MAQHIVSAVLHSSAKAGILQKQLITKYSTTSMKSIEEFYKGANVFITGGTGFLGKAMIAKLIRTCDFNSIILLVRPKRGISPEERLHEILKSEIFDSIKKQMPEKLKKIHTVAGDIGEKNLGLTPKDQQQLEDSVNIIFHSAATVKLNGPLPGTIQFNTLGTERVLNLAQNANNLKSFVYISSTFANCHLPEVKDIIYKSRYDPKAVINFTQNFPGEDVKLLENRLVGQHPGTYTFSKHLAENLILNNYKHLPISIVRPSSIISSWKEPLPGWIDNMYAGNGVAFGIGTGQLKSLPCKDSVTFDVIPVDIVANATLAVPWHVSQTAIDTVPVYNICSGDINKITVGRFIKETVLNSRKYPTKRLVWYPRHGTNIGRFKEVVLRNFVQRPIALFTDLTLWLTGKNTMAWKSNKKFEEFSNLMQYVLTHQASFRSENMCKLIKAVENSSSRDNFNVNMSQENGFFWEDFFPVYIKGLWKHVSKNDVEKDLEENRKLLRRAYFLDVGVKCILCSGIFTTILLIFVP